MHLLWTVLFTGVLQAVSFGWPLLRKRIQWTTLLVGLLSVTVYSASFLGYGDTQEPLPVVTNRLLYRNWVNVDIPAIPLLLASLIAMGLSSVLPRSPRTLGTESLGEKTRA